METIGAMVLFERSVEKLGVRYTTMVADGDSKAYDTVNEKLPYGPDYPIVKEECINHVSKRRGTALRNLATDFSKRGLIFKNSRTDMDIIIRYYACNSSCLHHIYAIHCTHVYT